MAFESLAGSISYKKKVCTGGCSPKCLGQGLVLAVISLGAGTRLVAVFTAGELEHERF